MNIHDMKETKFCKKEDVGDGVTVTIKNVTQENLAMEGKPEELKYILNFHEDLKPMVLNWTNIQLIAKATGSEETEGWTGKKIVLYTDDNVSFGGKLIGGIRVRRVQGATKPGKPVFAPVVDDLATEDDAPF